MSDEMERGRFEIANQTLDHTSNPAAPTYKFRVVSNRSLLAGMVSQPGQTLPRNTSLTPSNEPSQSADFLKRITRNGHSGWLIATLGVILVITMSLSFGFTRGWLDANTTLTASVVSLVLLFGVMLVAHWPSSNPR